MGGKQGNEDDRQLSRKSRCRRPARVRRGYARNDGAIDRGVQGVRRDLEIVKGLRWDVIRIRSTRGTTCRWITEGM